MPSNYRYDRNKLRNVQNEAKAWLLKEAIPLWSERGRQPCGLCAEKMDEKGQPDPAYYRVFVQARYIYAFAAAARLGYQGPWRERIAQIIETLLRHGRRQDGFFVHKLDRQGEVSDPQTDLYDQAFILLAFSECAWAFKDPAYFDQAQALTENLGQKWKRPHVGFYEGDRGQPGYVHQNPHMHLLEAFISLYERSGRLLFLQHVQRLTQMAKDYFFDKKSGGLIEDFHADMKPCLVDHAYRMEPGHCFEWSWLYERDVVRQLLGEADQQSERLVRFGRAFGLDKDRGIVINEVLSNGHKLDERGRLWPQTERIKAACSAFARFGREEDFTDILQGWRGLKRYFNPDHRGLWFDQMKPDGAFESRFSPASSLYHITCAIETLANL